MDAEEFRKRGREMVDYVADYLENIQSRRVFPEVKPGYIRELIPDHAPEEPDQWENVFKDIERVIMPGVCTFATYSILCLVFNVDFNGSTCQSTVFIIPAFYKN